MLYFLLLVLALNCKQIEEKDLMNSIQVIEDIDETNENIVIYENEYRIVRNYTDHGILINGILQTDAIGSDNICNHESHKFNALTPEYIDIIPQDQENDISIEDLENSEYIQNMVHISQGVFILDSKLSGYIYEFKNNKATLRQKIDLMDMRNVQEQQEQQESMLGYNPQSHTVYIIFNDQIVIVDIDLEEEESIIQYKDSILTEKIQIECVSSSSQYLYIGSSQYILVYKMDQQDGRLQYYYNITQSDMIETNKQIDINDIVVGGQQGNLLYILDKNSGVQIIEMIDKDNIERNRQIGIIDILGGYKLDQYNDQIVIVLQESVGQLRMHNAYEYQLNLNRGYWYFSNKYLLKSRVSDVDVSQNIAILHGVDSHKILFHSVWHGFTNNNLFVQQIYFPSLKHLDFYESTYGNANTSEQWHYSQQHDFIFAVNSYQLFYMNWTQIQPSIYCYPKQNQYHHNKYTYQINANTTSCQAKNYLLAQDNTLFSNLIICNYKSKFTVTVHKPIITSGITIILVTISLILFIFLFLFFIYLIFKNFRRYSIKKQALDREIQGFVSRQQDQSFDASQNQIQDYDPNKL